MQLLSSEDRPRVFEPLTARRELWPGIRRGRQRRNLAAGAVVLLAANVAFFGYAALDGGEAWQRLLEWPGPLLVLGPSAFLLGVVLLFSPLQIRDDLRKEAKQRLTLTPTGFAWQTERGRTEVRWHHVRAVYGFRRVAGRAVVLVAFVGGSARLGTDWVEVDEDLGEVRFSWGNPLLRGEDGVYRDPRRTPPEEHPIVHEVLARTNLELR